MKKNLFYLFALICSMSLFTACSDDDEPWQKLPNGEITPEKVDLILNGETTTGTVNFTATGAEAAKVELKNVIDGYSDVNVNVTMKEQTDGSFSFSGKESITTKPVTKNTATPVPFLVVTLDGTISKDGKTTMNVTAEGIGLYLGTYSGETLSLTYNGNMLSDRTVVLDATSGDNTSIQLQGVLPGEAEAVLSNIAYDGTNFSGTAATDLYSVELTGTRADKKLTLNVTSNLTDKGQGGLTGKWNLNVINPLFTSDFDWDTFETITTWNSNPPVYFNWTAKTTTDPTLKSPEQAARVLSTLCSHLLAEVLNSAAFTATGDLTAEYYSTPIMDKWWSNEAGEWTEVRFTDWLFYSMAMPDLKPADRTWIEAPKGLVQWYVKDGYFYIVPNIEAIMKQIAADQGGTVSGIDLATIITMLQEFGITLDETMLAQITGWLTNGIPLKYKVEGDILSLYVDKEMVAPFMNMLLPALPALWEKALAADTTGMASMLIGVLGFEDITDVQKVWENNTDNFDITLCFKK
nr:DUF4925 domain-containing protein [uncultured Bacteroides sp.]